MIITIKKLKKKVLLPEEDFNKLLHTAEKSEKIDVNLEEEFEDLQESSSASLSFWDNDIDDKVWNNA